jgi:hypothetical protein
MKEAATRRLYAGARKSPRSQPSASGDFIESTLLSGNSYAVIGTLQCASLLSWRAPGLCGSSARRPTMVPCALD